jgi:hypothetical protein
MYRRTSYFAALSLTALLVVIAGCGSDNNNPSAPLVDVIAPTVSATNPGSGATGVAIITASFSEPMNASTITAATFTVSDAAAVPVAGTVTYDASNERATFAPTGALATGATYTATITTGAKDAAGNALANNYTWGFTMSAQAGNQGTVALGAAEAFAVLGGSTVTSTGATALTGDLGVSPGSAVTGFPPGTRSGSTHAGDAVSAVAMGALTSAYNEAAGRTVAPVTVAGNIGGLTLPPGLYKSTSSLAISSGNLTLDAQGNPNAIFIFQVASTLTTTSGRAVILSGGAKSANVFWQVGTSVTLGTTSVFKGTIMANQSITLNTGANLNGRALARIGAVALSGSSVVLPTP